MEHTVCTIELAGIPIEIHLRHKENAQLFEKWYSKVPSTLPPVEISDDVYDRISEMYNTPAGIIAGEFTQTCLHVGDRLVAFDKALFHGVAFLWKGKAWILTAPSGTGKTTQYILWKLQYNNEVTLINGDKLLLSFEPDGTVTVSDSPWKGKENMSNDITAPLGGIIFLEQGKENHIERVTDKRIGGALFKQMFITHRSEAVYNKTAELTIKLVQSFPIWKLVNLGDKASAKLTHDTLLEYLSQSTS